MAERRMISISVVDTDWFLELPLSTQALYFHLLVRADDDGFIASPKSIIRKVGANQNDYDMLIAKRFILKFDSGVIVIKHWRLHNSIRKDRYNPTQFQEEFNQLDIKENGAYTDNGNQVETKRQPSGNTGKDSIGKDSIGKELDNYILSETDTKNTKKIEIMAIYDTWTKSENLIKHKECTVEIEKEIIKALKKYKCEEIVEAIKHYDMILGSKWYFDYKWSLTDFLKQKNALPGFVEDGSKWQSFQEDLKKNPYLLPMKEEDIKPTEINPLLKNFINNIS